ncbi:MAG: hypothetical protein EBR82_10150 [Caulobacteraceae bacterium]|nr:hypothetical protein [Caulobacteraceae bacterium]
MTEAVDEVVARLTPWPTPDLFGYFQSLHSLPLADRLAAVKHVAKMAKEEEAKIVEAAKDELGNGEVIVAESGRAFEMVKTERRTFGKPVIHWLKQSELLDKVVTSVSRKDLDAAKKAKVLTSAAYGVLIDMADITVSAALRDKKLDVAPE